MILWSTAMLLVWFAKGMGVLGKIYCSLIRRGKKEKRKTGGRGMPYEWTKEFTDTCDLPQGWKTLAVIGLVVDWNPLNSKFLLEYLRADDICRLFLPKLQIMKHAWDVDSDLRPCECHFLPFFLFSFFFFYLVNSMSSLRHPYLFAAKAANSERLSLLQSKVLGINANQFPVSSQL